MVRGQNIRLMLTVSHTGILNRTVPPVTTLQVAVGGMFTVDVWIRGILSSDGLNDLYLVVT